MPWVRQKAAAAHLGVSVRYFRDHVRVIPKTLPGRGTKPVLVWNTAELDAWVERVNNPRARPHGPSGATRARRAS